MGTGLLKSLLIAGAAALALQAEATAAQPTPGAGSAPSCEGFEQPPSAGLEPVLHVVCGRAGTMLGPVDAFEMVDLPALRSAVVVSTLHGSKRVWLVMQEGDRVLAVEEITGTVARSMGRGPHRRIDDLDLDLGRGAAGLLTASLKPGTQRPGGASAPTRADIDLAGLVARARQVRGADAVTAE